jgi:Cu/Ag efflux protein CusF
MKKYSIAMRALLLALFVIAFGVSNQISAHEGRDQQTLHGTVSSVDSDGGELKIKDAEGEEKTLPVSSSTKISKGGKEIKLADIKTGDKVRYIVEEESVKEIEVEG